MTNTISETDWIKTHKGEPDGDPVYLDKNDCKVVINTNSKLIKSIEKAIGSTPEHAKIVMYAFGLAFLLNEGTKHGPKIKGIFYNKTFRTSKELCVYLCRTIPDAKESHKQKAIARYHKEGGKTAALINSHGRHPPNFHFECPICNATLGFSKSLFETRTQHWKNLFVGNGNGGHVKKHPKFKALLIEKYGKDAVHLHGDNSLVDQFWQTWTESEFYVKPHHKKYPKDNESLTKHIADKKRTELKDEGIVEKKKKDFTLDDDRKIITLSHFRNQHPRHAHLNNPIKETWMKVAEMMGYTRDEWEGLRNEIKDYSKENNIDFDKVEKPKEKVNYDDDYKHDHSNDGNDSKSAI